MRTPRLPRALLLLAVIGTGVSGFLPEPKLSVQTLIELGSGEMAVCEVSNQSESDSLLINMYLQNKKLSTTQTREGDKEIAQATLSFDQAGTYTVKCTASNELDSKTASSSIIVYNFPDPLLVSEEDEDDGENIMLTCTLPKVSPMVEIHIRATGTILTCEDQSSNERSCSVPNQKDFDGMTVTCGAVMSLPGKVWMKEKTTVLDIEYAPGFTDDGCPTNQTLREGEVNVVLCNAVGKPIPEVSCSKDTLTYPKGILAEVKGNHSGKYTCRAKNKLDIAKKMITVSVQENPSKLINRASSGTILSAMLVMVCHMF
ncbi:intercellular adhesion molecule 1-like [Lissotriton helveticus]